MRMMAFLAVLTTAAGFTACSDDPAKPDDSGPTYSESLAHPEDVLNDLVVSYRRREIDPYANLLAPEFIFVFQEDDATGIPEAFWTASEDSAGTASLFGCIVDIRLEMEWFEPADATTTGGEPALRVAAIANLDVDIDDATTLRVSGTLQHFFFRPGKVENGEDPDRWFLSEWRDLGDAGSAGAPTLGERFSGGRVESIFGASATISGTRSLAPAVESYGWGRIKRVFSCAPSPRLDTGSPGS
jgi:hypothetical protein